MSHTTPTATAAAATLKLADILKPEDVLIETVTHSRASLIRRLAAHAALRAGVAEEAVRLALTRREELGSTGIGQGVALPHAAIDGLPEALAVMFVLKHAVDFHAIDGAPVDLVFLLLTPGDASGRHLSVLSAAARRLNARDTSRALRSATSPIVVYSLLVAPQSPKVMPAPDEHDGSGSG